MMEYWVMGKWVTCREPLGHAIGKNQNNEEVQDVYK
jgi:hypothetical protein